MDNNFLKADVDIAQAALNNDDTTLNENQRERDLSSFWEDGSLFEEDTKDECNGKM